MTQRIFYSYSHVDSDLRAKLGTYLAPLVHQKKIEEWHDRKIEPGQDWNSEISAALKSADIILLLVSADFLASQYCFGVEVDEALARLNRGEARVVPILLKPCLWEESRFSALQHVPRDGKPVSSWASCDDALREVAKEIRDLVSRAELQVPTTAASKEAPDQLSHNLDLVRRQVFAYARQYEMTRQRMAASAERTHRMEQIFQRMRSIAVSSYPLLGELSNSHAPGERLAAVAILQIFADEQSLEFLVRLIASEKPFVGYQAAVALKAAVETIDPRAYPQLLDSILDAQSADEKARLGFDTDRLRTLREAERDLRATMNALATSTPDASEP